MSIIASKVILVTGATGNQGGALVKALAALNSSKTPAYRILALTRSTTSPASVAISSLPGVQLVQGELSTLASVFESHKDIDGVFSVQAKLPGGVTEEVQMGKLVADEAAKAGVKHLVYSGVDFGGLAKTDIPHFESKREIENYIKFTYPKLPLTILRPVYFMNNLSTASTAQGKIGVSILFDHTFSSPSKTIQMISATDIGKIAAEVFAHRDEFIGQTIPLAGDELTVEQIRGEFKEVLNEDLEVPEQTRVMARNILKGNDELRPMFKFFETDGYKADIPAIRKRFPQTQDFKTFLATEVGHGGQR